MREKREKVKRCNNEGGVESEREAHLEHACLLREGLNLNPTLWLHTVALSIPWAQLKSLLPKIKFLLFCFLHNF